MILRRHIPGWAFCVAGAWLWLAPVEGNARSLEALDAVVAQAADLNDFLNQPKLLAQYRQALEGYYGRDLFQCESFDAVVRELKRLNGELPLLGKRLWKTFEPESPMEVVEFAGTSANRPEARFRLRPLTRRIHGIWLNPSEKGCAGAECSRADLAAPQRWAVSLRQASVFVVERNGLFQKSGILTLPLKKAQTPFRLVSVIGGAEVHRRGYFRREDVPVTQRTSLFELWVARQASRTSAPLVRLEYLKDDERLARLAPLAPATGNRSPAGFVDEFRPADPLASLIAEVAPRKCFSAKEQKGWNLFAGFGGLDQLAAEGGPAILAYSSQEPLSLPPLPKTTEFSLSLLPGKSPAGSALQQGNAPSVGGVSPDLQASEQAAPGGKNKKVTINLFKKPPQGTASGLASGAPSKGTPSSTGLSSRLPLTTPALAAVSGDRFSPDRFGSAAQGSAGGNSPPLSEPARLPSGLPGMSLPGGTGSGRGSSGPLERARRAAEDKLDRGLPLSDDEFDELLNGIQNSENGRERNRAIDTLVDEMSRDSGQGRREQFFAEICTQKPTPDFCRQARDRIQNRKPECEGCKKVKDFENSFEDDEG